MGRLSLGNNNNNNVFFSVPFLPRSTRPITWNKLSKKKKIIKAKTLCDRPVVLPLSLFLYLSPSFSLSHPHTQSVGLLKKIGFQRWFKKDRLSVMIWRMRGCWMTWFRKGECSRLPAQLTKMTFNQASVCVQWEYREWKYQKMSEVGA